MARKEALRLEYLDGLRAVASVYVLLFHSGVGFNSGNLKGFAHVLRQAFAYGHDAVAVFIVLSGYCLMLPVARAEGQLVRGLASYFARRAWRILPPYYATVLGSLSLIALLPVLHTPTETIWADTFPAFGFAPIASHLFLVHNLFQALSVTIDGPLWSVATEWQIYFFFPLLLLPVWRRFGALASIAVGFVVAGLLAWLAPEVAHTANAWYIGLFAVGMAAAGVSFASRARETQLRERAPWGVLSLLLLALLAVGCTVLVKLWFRHIPFSDVLVGLTTASSLVYLTRNALGASGEPRSAVLRLLESAPLVGLGRFSYSLYLTHLPVVALCYFGLRGLALSESAAMLLLVALSLPASLLVSYAFFWVFERRFVGSPAAFFRKPAL